MNSIPEKSIPEKSLPAKLLSSKVILSVLLTTAVLLLTSCGKKECSTIAYYDDGKIIYENGKVVAAYLTLKLVDEGKITLEDKIAPYISQEFITDDKRVNDITVQQLLSHTAGFSPSYELGIDKKLYSDPGVKFRYSGVGYIYLQNVIVLCRIVFHVDFLCRIICNCFICGVVFE